MIFDTSVAALEPLIQHQFLTGWWPPSLPTPLKNHLHNPWISGLGTNRASSRHTDAPTAWEQPRDGAQLKASRTTCLTNYFMLGIKKRGGVPSHASSFPQRPVQAVLDSDLQSPT